jgi:hypothetical protein
MGIAPAFRAPKGLIDRLGAYCEAHNIKGGHALRMALSEFLSSKGY